MSKENFKLFARNHPELVGFIKNGDMTWQKFYEIYDIYGEDTKAWSSYINSSSKPTVSSFQDILGNINTESIQKHINTAQKAIGVVQELAGKKGSANVTNLVKGPVSPRPINKFFED